MNLWKKIYSFLFVAIIILFSKSIDSYYFIGGLIGVTSLIFIIFPSLLIAESFLYFIWLYYNGPSIYFDYSIFYLITFVLIIWYLVFLEKFEQREIMDRFFNLKGMMCNACFYTLNTTIHNSKALFSIIKSNTVIRKNGKGAYSNFFHNKFNNILNSYDSLINGNYYSAKFMDYIFFVVLSGSDEISIKEIKVIKAIKEAIELYQPLKNEIDIKIDEDFCVFASKFHLIYLISYILNIGLNSRSEINIYEFEKALIIRLNSKNIDFDEVNLGFLKIFVKKIYGRITLEHINLHEYLFKIEFSKRRYRILQVLAKIF
jgi:hypothetical protein